jgi:hypothetical protein
MGAEFHFQRYLSYILAARALLAEESGLHGKNNDLPHQIKLCHIHLPNSRE